VSERRDEIGGSPKRIACVNANFGKILDLDLGVWTLERESHRGSHASCPMLRLSPNAHPRGLAGWAGRALKKFPYAILF
jgi:hypothetical protein